jgi:hypothetical protein
MAITANRNVPQCSLLTKRSSLMKRELVPLHHAYKPTCTGLELMPLEYDLGTFCSLYFIASVVIGPPVFLCKCSNYTVFCCNLWKRSCFGPLQHFQVFFVYIGVSVFCLHLWMFASETLKFLAAFQLLIFPVWLIGISLNFAL